MKILAVDDNSITLELLKLMVAKIGFTDMSTATSGETALNLINKGDVFFDCLLLDISMPDMNGVELCGLVRAIPAYMKTPIIMLTGMTDRYNIDGAFLAGATDYATKPFDIVDLDARLRAAEEMVGNRKIAFELTNTNTERTQSDVSNKQLFSLSEEIQIEGVKAIIGYEVFRNYLAQLSRAGLAASQVIAVKIDHIKTIYTKASSGEFLYTITEVAVAISDGMIANGHMMAYVGNGTFLVISHKVSMESSVEIEVKIQNFLDERNLEYDNGDPLDIEVAIGNPIRPIFDSSQQSQKTFARAIARAESRAIQKQNEPKILNIRLVKR